MSVSQLGSVTLPGSTRSYAACFFFLAAMLDARDIETIGTILPLKDARTGHETLDGIRSRPRGKIVLRHDT